MTQPSVLPPEIQQLADQLGEQPPAMRDLLRYAFVLAMIDDEKAQVIATRTEDDQEWLTVETREGTVFDILHPAISEELEAEILERVRTILEEEAE